MFDLMLALLVALLISLIVTPAVIRLAHALGAVDQPGARKVHAKPMPRMGGLAVYVAFVAAVFFTQPLTMPVIGLLTGATIILGIGIWDDLRSMPPVVKLLGQVLAAATLIPFGIHVEFLTNPFGGLVYLGYFGIPLTIFWVVAVTNAVNLIDGLDGLASGTALIATLTLGVVTLVLGNSIVAPVAFILAGAILGFLRYNFFPARVFLGDTGSLFLGYVLATLAIMGLAKGATALSVIIPLVILGIPLTDTFLAIVRRYRNRMPIFGADKGHLHHRLLGAGLSHRNSVLALYGVNFILGASAVLLVVLSTARAVVLLFVLALLLLTVANRLGLLGYAWQRKPERPVKSKRSET